MTAARVCPQCGKPLSSDAPQGLCPECLLKAALPGQSALESSATGIYQSPANAIAPEAGLRLKYFGDYELLEEIARGGMGVVWKARQTSLNRDVALKMIRAGALASPEEVRRFLREAEAAANLQHPNIVAIHEVSEQGGQHYFTMDYVVGCDLGAIVKGGSLPPYVAARYVKIIAEAIHFAHQRGTLHRDLKPQNVLIDASDQPRITDFGLAKIIKDDSRLTQSGVVMGSPSYMPPEQAAGRHGDVGPASDVYSLGALFYELLTGRPPFRGATALDTLRLVLEAEPAEPRRLKAEIPVDLETICLKCLEKSPMARFPTARALAEELDRFLKGEPIQARPASAVRKIVSWARRHPRTLATLAALVMIALAFGVFYLIEENAMLRAQNLDPALARVPGPRRESLRLWSMINLFAAIPGVFTLLALAVWRRNPFFKERFDVLMLAGPTQPLGGRTRTLVIGAGLILVGCGVMLLVTLIQAYVWEGAKMPLAFIFAMCALSCLSIEFGLVSLVTVIQDYRLVNYGTSGMSGQPSRPLTAEQIEPIRRALEEDDWVAAVKRYREAVPDASFTEPVQYVACLRESLRTQYPDKFAQPPLSLAALNWKSMGSVALTFAAFLGVLWFLEPPSYPAAAVSLFAYSFLFGMAAKAVTRVKGLWQRLLVWVPALLVMVSSEAMLRSTEGSWRTMGPYLFGFVFGVYLMVCGFIPRRKQGASKP